MTKQREGLPPNVALRAANFHQNSHPRSQVLGTRRAERGDEVGTTWIGIPHTQFGPVLIEDRQELFIVDVPRVLPVSISPINPRWASN